MLTELGKKRLTEILVNTFGKTTFSEAELTKEFWNELYIQGNDFFCNDDGCVDLDFFWSASVKEWIVQDKKEWLKAHKTTIE